MDSLLLSYKRLDNVESTNLELKDGKYSPGLFLEF